MFGHLLPGADPRPPLSVEMPLSRVLTRVEQRHGQKCPGQGRANGRYDGHFRQGKRMDLK